MNISLNKPDPELILTFNLDGTVEKETVNFEGKSCTEMTAFLEEAVKAKDVKRQFKPEYNKITAPRQKIRN